MSHNVTAKKPAFEMSLLKRTWDIDKVYGVLEHPAIWDAIGGNEVDNKEMNFSDKYHYLYAPGAVFILHPEGDDWMVHVNVIPEVRDRAYEMAMEVYRYAFEHLGANKVVAEIPEEYDNVYRFALKCGMQEDEFVDGEHKMSMGYERWAQ